MLHRTGNFRNRFFYSYFQKCRLTQDTLSDLFKFRVATLSPLNFRSLPFLMEQMDFTISDSAEASKSPSFLWSKWHKSKPKTPVNVRNSKQQTDRSARGTMFKLGIAFVAVALFVCSCYADLLTEELNSLTEHSNGNLKDRGSDSKTTGEDDGSLGDDGSGSGDEASGLKQEQGYNRVFCLIL